MSIDAGGDVSTLARCRRDLSEHFTTERKQLLELQLFFRTSVRLVQGLSDLFHTGFLNSSSMSSSLLTSLGVPFTGTWLQLVHILYLIR